jgi:hypothetical protein
MPPSSKNYLPTRRPTGYGPAMQADTCSISQRFTRKKQTQKTSSYKRSMKKKEKERKQASLGKEYKASERR